jgi:hypothetical protein
METQFLVHGAKKFYITKEMEKERARETLYTRKKERKKKGQYQ